MIATAPETKVPVATMVEPSKIWTRPVGVPLVAVTITRAVVLRPGATLMDVGLTVNVAPGTSVMGV